MEAKMEMGRDLHMRPIQKIAETAGRFESDIRISSGGKSANAKNLLEMIELASQAGPDFTVSARGKDETAAVRAMLELANQDPAGV